MGTRKAIEGITRYELVDDGDGSPEYLASCRRDSAGRLAGELAVRGTPYDLPSDRGNPEYYLSVPSFALSPENQ